MNGREVRWAVRVEIVVDSEEFEGKGPGVFRTDIGKRRGRRNRISTRDKKAGI